MKRTAERLLCGAGVPWVSRLVRARHGVVLAYHNVVPDDARLRGEPSLHLPRTAFAAQLDLLVRDHDVVPLDQLLDGPGAGRRPRAAITFDDAYRGAVTIGVSELAARGLAATIFVSPALLGRESFWWDALAEPGIGLREGFRRRALEELRGEDAAIRAHARSAGQRIWEVDPLLAPATEDELRAAAGQPGISLGSHSWSHANLGALPPAELDRQLVRPLAWLRERFQGVVPWLSLPYGLSSDLVAPRAQAAGYQRALRIEGGPLPRDSKGGYAVPRINIPAGISPNGFELRVAGVTGR